jgi:hypothetical protein
MRFVPAKKFPQPSFDPIAHNGPSPLFPNRQPQPGPIPGIWFNDYQKVGQAFFSGLRRSFNKIAMFSDPVFRSQGLGSSTHLSRFPSAARPISDRQTLSSLGPAAVNNVPSGPGAHTHQEPVGPGPFDVAGLKCSFHMNASP